VELGVDDAGDLDCEAAVTGVDQAGRDQPVVVGDGAEHLLLGDAEAFQLRRIDDDLEHLLALAADVDVEHGGDELDLVFEVVRQMQQSALRHLARQRDRDHRIEAGVELLDRRRIGLGRQ
jgi:hypothetical protein